MSYHFLHTDVSLNPSKIGNGKSLALEVVLPFIRDAQDQAGNCNDYEGYISTPPAEGYNVEMNPFYCDDRLFECCVAPS